MVPLFAILLLVILAFGALAMDGGLAFSDKRSDQNIADNAALAAVRDLGGTSPSLTQARKDAVEYVLRGLGVATAAPASCTYTSDIDDSSNKCNWPVSGTPTYEIQVYTPPKNTPSSYTGSPLLNAMIEVRVTHHLTGALMAAANIASPLNAGADAIAVDAVGVGGNTYIAFGTASGNGNTVDNVGTSQGQLDDGSNGASNTSCTGGTGPLADLASNDKLHAPQSATNINGAIDHGANDADNQYTKYWQPTSVIGGVSHNDPGYAAPSSTVSNYQTVYGSSTAAAPSVSGTVVTFHPGHYTSPLTVQPGGSFGGVNFPAGSTFVFQNGIYWFDGASLVFAPGTTYPAYPAYSQDYSTSLNGGAGGFPTGRTAGPDGVTDGVEFYMSGAGYFWAKGGVVNLRAPSNIDLGVTQTGQASSPGTSNFVGVYVDKTSTADTGQTTKNANGNGVVTNNVLAIGYGDGATGYGQVSDGSQYFHLEGTAYVQASAVNKSPSAIVEGSSLDYRKYAVQGQVIAPYLGLNMGVNTNASAWSGSCVIDSSKPTTQGPTKVVQFDAHNVPNLNIGESLAGLVQ